jgi:ubiquinol-cytochrome c reductase cytochrome b subunit
MEIHQPLADVDHHGDGDGHGQLEYAGWVVPKKMNRVGALPPTERGFFRPVEDATQREDGHVPEMSAEEKHQAEILSGD